MGVPPRPGRGSVPAGDPARLSGESDDVQPGVGAVGQVDEAALVRLHVVGLDRDLAASRPVRHAALGGPLGRGGGGGGGPAGGGGGGARRRPPPPRGGGGREGPWGGGGRGRTPRPGAARAGPAGARPPPRRGPPGPGPP